MKLLLIRHGETDWNKENRVLGRSDIPLNDMGQRQANDLVDQLHTTRIHAIYSSPLKRASHIGNMIAKDHQLEEIIDDRLIEMDFGIFEGVDRNDLNYQRQKRSVFTRFKNGESYLEIAGRVYPFLKEIRKEHSEDAVLIVTHNGICRIIASYFVDMSLEEFVTFSMSNAEVKEFIL